MHKIQMYENLMDLLEREVKEIANKGELDMQSLDILYKVMMAIKATDKHMETLEGQGMSQDSYGRGSNESRNSSRRSYDSYARRGRDGDGDGRYSEDSFRDSSYRGRSSYEDSYGYSRDAATDAMKKKIEDMMKEPVSDSVRMALMECLNKIK